MEFPRNDKNKKIKILSTSVNVCFVIDFRMFNQCYRNEWKNRIAEWDTKVTVEWFFPPSLFNHLFNEFFKWEYFYFALAFVVFITSHCLFILSLAISHFIVSLLITFRSLIRFNSFFFPLFFRIRFYFLWFMIVSYRWIVMSNSVIFFFNESAYAIQVTKKSKQSIRRCWWHWVTLVYRPIGKK